MARNLRNSRVEPSGCESWTRFRPKPACRLICCGSGLCGRSGRVRVRAGVSQGGGRVNGTVRRLYGVDSTFREGW